MRAVLYATLARADLVKKLGAILGDDLTVVDDAEALAAAMPEAEALFVGDMLLVGKAADAVYQQGGKLKWIQILTAGYDNVKKHGAPNGAQVTNVGDALAPGVGLHALSLLLTLQRQVPAYVKNQDNHGWDRSAAAKMTTPIGQTAVVLGFGHIGREIARLMRALGSHVIGVSRTGAADAGADEMLPFSRIGEAVGRADSIFVSLPLDAATHHLFNASLLSQCRKNAVLVNIARGGLIDQIALTDALKAGTIAGAALDVTDPEPLPPEHPLWDAPNLYISPHCAGAAGALTTERISDKAAENLKRYIAGEALADVVKL